jgi:hypothetical protein
LTVPDSSMRRGQIPTDEGRFVLFGSHASLFYP